MAPWQVDKARRGLSGTGAPTGSPSPIQAVAAADFEVKGGGRDPVYAVERADPDHRPGPRRPLSATRAVTADRAGRHTDVLGERARRW